MNKNTTPITVLLCLFLSFGLFSGGFSQTKSVQIQKVKDLTDAHEFIITWEGGIDYKTTYYEVMGIVEREPRLISTIYLWKIKQISAIFPKSYSPNDLGTVFKNNGFAVTLAEGQTHLDPTQK